MIRSAILALLASVLLSTQAQAQPAAPLARVSEGTLRGASENGLSAFRGVPYAAPPVGALRWRAPQPRAHWRGVREATAFSPSCMQSEMPNGVGPWSAEFFPHNGDSEDCLYLNVWTPNAHRGARLPVMLFIPGGGFRNGSGSVPLYDGAALARRGIIVVTMNYRVGAFGFLARPDLPRERDGGSGNYGLRDVLAALHWLRTNVAAFGGDPTHITLDAQSAGGAMVDILLTSPAARGLFVSAIVQSSPFGAFPTSDRATAETTGAQFAAALNATSLNALRGVSAEEVLAASDRFGFRPYIDGVIAPGEPTRLLAAGRVNDMPLLTGFVANETRDRLDLFALTSQTAARYGASSASLLTLYPARTDAEALEAGLAMDRDRTLAGVNRFAQARTRAGHAPLYLYLWTHEEPSPDAARDRAFHSSELVYVFSAFAAAPQRTFTDTDRSISQTMLGYWSNFVKTANPNGEGLAPWPRADGSPAPIMELGDHFAPLAPLDPAKRAAFEQSFAASHAFAF